MSANSEPSLGQRLSYYFLDRRLPKEHEQWVERDIQSPIWPWRNGLRDGLFILLGASIGAAISENETAIVAALIAIPAILVMRFLGRERARRNSLQKHLV